MSNHRGLDHILLLDVGGEWVEYQGSPYFPRDNAVARILEALVSTHELTAGQLQKNFRGGAQRVWGVSAQVGYYIKIKYLQATMPGEMVRISLTAYRTMKDPCQYASSEYEYDIGRIHGGTTLSVVQKGADRHVTIVGATGIFVSPASVMESMHNYDGSTWSTSKTLEPEYYDAWIVYRNGMHGQPGPVLIGVYSSDVPLVAPVFNKIKVQLPTKW